MMNPENNINQSTALVHSSTEMSEFTSIHNKFINHLARLNGNVSKACRKYNISRKTYYNWRQSISGFARAADEAIYQSRDKRVDLAEEKLVENIKERDRQSIIFLLKTQGKDRGYIEHKHITKQSEELKVIKIIKASEVIHEKNENS